MDLQAIQFDTLDANALDRLKPQFTDEVAGAVAGMVVGRDRMEGV